jgi:hypothetical protein
MNQRGVADGAVAASWSGYYISNVIEINEVLKTVLLVASIVATVIAMRYHLRNTPN